MNNKFSSVIAIFICAVLVFSLFTACGTKPENGENPTLSPDESWYPGTDSPYEPVTISSVELADIVNEALGDEAKSFDGNLGSLTKEQLEKVEKLAQKKGYTIETDPQGKPVIKDPSHAQASDKEIEEILSRAGVADASKVSKEEYEKVSKAAAESGMTAVTDPNGKIDIIKPTTTAPAVRTTKVKKTSKVTTKKNNNNNTQQGQDSPGVQKIITSMAQCAWKGTYSTKTNDTFVASAVMPNGVVCVGSTFSASEDKSVTKTGSLIVAFDTEGKKMWSKTLAGDNITSFESVAVLTDGSIIAAGSTVATDIASDAEYKCKGTVEGLVVKYSSNGERQWLKLYGGSSSDMINAVEATPDGGFIIGGKTSSSDGDFRDITTHPISAFAIKCDANGNRIWKKTIGSTKHCAFSDFAVTESGIIYGVAVTYFGDGEFANIQNIIPKRKSVVCIKMDANGNQIWSRGFSDTGATELNSITVSKDGGCVLAGQYSTDKSGSTNASFGKIYNGGAAGTYDGIVVKVSPDGYTKWILPLVGYESDYITGVTRVNGGYAVSGYTTSSNRDFHSNSGNYDSFVYIISEYGEKQTFASFGGSNADTARAICGDGGTTVYICGITNSGDGYFADCADKGNENCAVGFNFRYNLIQS